MKKVLLLLLSVAVLLVAGGCDYEFGSIESLMRPPLSATERKLSESISKLLGNGISLRAPQAGTNHSAITLHDLDGDAQSEAIVFYANEEVSSVVRMSVLKKTSNSWAIVSDFAGSGIGIYSLDFCDLNNDGCDDMLVSWYLFEDKVNKTLTVYSCSRNGNEVSFSACATEPYNLMHVEDVFGNGEKQIVLVYTDLSRTKGKNSIRLMRLNRENRVVQLCKKTLDNRIISFSSISSDKSGAAQTARIFVDADISDSERITLAFTWNNETDNFVSLFDYSGADEPTKRGNNLAVTDIDGDGLLEVPQTTILPLAAQTDVPVGYMLVWNGISGGRLVAEEYYFVNLQGNYRLYLPKQYFGKVFVSSNNLTGHWSFVNSEQQKLFDIVIYDAEKWNEYSDKVTAMVYSNNSKVYACNITQAGLNYGIKAEDLVKYFSMNT